MIPVEVGEGLIGAGAVIQAVKDHTRVCIVSDDNVWALYGHFLQEQLEERGVEVQGFYFEAGEERKIWPTVASLQSQIMAWGVDRRAVVVALGGGVVTDVAGFVAATLLRGLDLVMVPTSLLAMVDAAIGSKVGINHDSFKNMIGAFYDPISVIVDPQCCLTLNDAQLREGIVEMIKHGAILDESFFDDLERLVLPIANRQIEVLCGVIEKSIRIKQAVVSADRTEKSTRRCLLNFGHTIGHALESVTGGKISHGEAVALGMVVEAKISFEMGISDRSVLESILSLLRRYQLPLQWPKGIDGKALIAATIQDKKAVGGEVRYVLVERIGSAFQKDGEYVHAVESSLVKNVIEEVSKGDLLLSVR